MQHNSMPFAFFLVLRLFPVGIFAYERVIHFYFVAIAYFAEFIDVIHSDAFLNKALIAHIKNKKCFNNT